MNLPLWSICCLLLGALSSGLAVEVGTDLSSLALPLRDGPSTVAAYKGKVLLLDLWATWCAPCHKSLPWMNTLPARFRERGLEVVAVSIDESAEKLTAFLERMPLQMTVGHDPSAAIAKTLAPPAMPTTLLIDRSGVVRVVHGGFRPGDDALLEGSIQALLDETKE
jgi:peroxiredoxin